VLRRSIPALSALVLAAAGLTGSAASAQARPLNSSVGASSDCFTPPAVAARGVNGAKDPNDLSDAQAKAMEDALDKALSAKGLHKSSDGAARTPGGTAAFTATTVKVYWHTITDSTKGVLSASQINNQIGVLNAAYAPVGVSFTLVSTDTTNNASWYNGLTNGTTAEKAMKTTLH
jgi:hypothetical protein